MRVAPPVEEAHGARVGSLAPFFRARSRSGLETLQDPNIKMVSENDKYQSAIIISSFGIKSVNFDS